MNDLSTVKQLYPGAFPQPDAGEDDAPYPKGERIGTIDYEEFVAGGD